MALMMVILVLAVLALCTAPGAFAFGAGEIPDVSAMAKIAYRHGTIENVLENIAKSASGGRPNAGRLIAGVAGAFLTGNAGNLGNLVSGAVGEEKFTGLDIKRVYFGNWLRDYSQAMDIAGLSKLNGDSIVLVIMCLGFMAFGYATEEFEVTKEKLGVYLCTEHIDNPKGYSSEAQQYDMRLRPPVKDVELEIDPNNGMKKYIATEGEGFETSTSCIRMHLRRCIELGRNGGEKERFEAYRELGTALHTLEDYLAHSNYLELALNKLGHRNVFCHVGDNARVRAPNGQNVPPIVTGTFGGSDFLVSVMGEVGDKLSSSTVNDLNAKFDDAKNQKNQKGNGVELVKALMSKIGGGGNSQDVDSQLENVEQIRKNAINIDPSKVASKEVQKIFVNVLRTRDSIFKNIEHTLEQLGLDDYIDELTNALSILVLTTLEPYVAPIIKTVTEGLTAGSSAILQQEDQLLVFNDGNASDPTHSVLSKDHFDLWLNEPAGLVAIEVVKHTVPLIVQAWGDNSANADQVIDVILQALHHPYFARDDSEIQRKMLDTVREWVDGMDSQKRNRVINSLSKESVRNGNNKREEAESYGTLGHRCGPGHSHHSAVSGAGGGYGGHQSSHQLATGNRLAGNPVQNRFGQDDHSSQEYGQPHAQPGGIAGGFGSLQQSIGDRMEQRYGGQERNSNQSYGGQQASHENQYGQQQTFGGRRDEDYNVYGRQGRDNDANGYGREGRDDNGGSFGRQGRYGDDSGRQDERPNYGRHGEEPAYGRQPENISYHGRPDNEPSHGGRRDDETAYGRHDNSASYGRHDNAPSYGRHDDTPSFARHDNTDSYGRRNDEHDRHRSDYNYSRQEGFPRRDDGESDQNYGRSSFGRQEESYGRDNRREEEERHADTRYGGEDLGYRFGGMNLSSGDHRRRNDDNERHDGFQHRFGHDAEPALYGGRNDNEDTEQRRFGGGRRGDDDERHGFGGGRYGRQEYGHRGGRDEEIFKKDKSKGKDNKKSSDSDSGDDKMKKERKYKAKKESDGSSDEEKKYKKELKKTQKKEEKMYKKSRKSDDDSSGSDSDNGSSNKYGRKFYH